MNLASPEDLRATVAAAETKALTATERLDDAREAHANAQGALRMATAKAEAFEADAKKSAWQRVAAQEAVAKAQRAVARAAALIVRRERELLSAQDALADAVAALAEADSAGADGPEGAADDGPHLAPLYADTESWVSEFFIPAFSRSTGSRWCAQWWLHTEAVIAFRALWMSWEGARLENGPSSIATWLIHNLYPLHREICGPAGPFAACTADRHAAQELWPAMRVPADFWPADDLDAP